MGVVILLGGYYSFSLTVTYNFFLKKSMASSEANN